MDKDKKRQLVYEVIILLHTALLLAFITRLWPVILLLFLTIIICAFRMLFLKFNTVDTVPSDVLLPEAAANETEQSMATMAFRILQIRVTEKVMECFPSARWVWETSNPIEAFVRGEALIIHLNGAGGYRKAKLTVFNLMLKHIEFEGAKTPPKAVLPETIPEENIDSKKIVDSEPDSEDDRTDDEKPVNYERLAFEWVEDNMFSLNERANEALIKDAPVLIAAEELPVPDSWVAICEELKKNGFADTAILENGIQANLTKISERSDTE